MRLSTYMILKSVVSCHNKKFKLWITKFEYETFNSFSNLYSFLKFQNITYTEKYKFLL